MTFQVFELVVNCELFKYEAFDKYNLDAPTNHLWQMLGFTGERFTPEQLESSDHATQYFDDTCLSPSLLRVLHSHNHINSR